MIFVISAALAGLAGAFSAHYIAYVDPKSFSFDQSVLILSMVILGGMGNLEGSVIGAVALCAIPELLRGFESYRLVFYGVVIVVLMLWKPNGLLGKYNFNYMRLRSEFARKKKATAGGTR